MVLSQVQEVLRLDITDEHIAGMTLRHRPQDVTHRLGSVCTAQPTSHVVCGMLQEQKTPGKAGGVLHADKILQFHRSVLTWQKLSTIEYSQYKNQEWVSTTNASLLLQDSTLQLHHDYAEPLLTSDKTRPDVLLVELTPKE